ncbi:helix-turn-helix domain-containing protein [Anoxynatronum buryatiense]|uniref:Transcriptional regulator, contains XRE-family HTH domain n=1 Tax=Anoxynatronum buryatiense TaxID=489973 RepID=A0AA46AK58_9CLOT|nr:helix-turn-helix transcriptional regulator [Anoxynatronum buryatiense]SMP66671.1 Transcriptional regulator, contains XRE-family HTH domain [Anoxynatronum buryatiense]
MKLSTHLVGPRIRLLREEKHISRETLAEVLKLSESYIGLVERGARGITLENLITIANYFHVTLDYFVVVAPAGKSAERLHQLSGLIDALHEDQFDLVLRLVNDLSRYFYADAPGKQN